MSIIIFLIVLAVLILVHEFGHFIVAKKSDIKVTEFGLGFPPKLWGIKKGETLYSLNAIPFGGFVKIFGEDPDEISATGPDSNRSLANKPHWIQAAVLVAGVTFNVLFAWLLLSVGYMTGLPSSVSYEGPGSVENPQTIITSVAPDSPADKAGFKVGDAIVGLSVGSVVAKEMDPSLISNFVEAHPKDEITANVRRGKELMSIVVTPTTGVVEGKVAIGVAMDVIGTLKLPPHLAIWEGAKTSWAFLVSITIGIVEFFANTFSGNPDLSQITGPVGLAGLVGDVSQLGFVYLLSFTAIISLNLAIINLLPLPALDGGRLVVVAIEAISRKKLNPKFLGWVNGVGFALLILLMVAITVHDVIRLN